MCAIFGLGFLKGHKVTSSDFVINLIRALFLENMERGRTAAGLAYVSDRDITIVKKNLAANNLINTPEYKNTESERIVLNPDNRNMVKTQILRPIISVIGHCRLKTKGTELDNNNNHPIVRKSVVGVHNGCIMNDDALFSSYEMEFSRNGEVDSEIIFALIEHFSTSSMIHVAIQRMSRVVSGSMACAMVHSHQPHVVWFFRRSNPCYVVIFKKVGLVIWSSSDKYIDTAVLDYYNFGRGEKIEFEPLSGIGINLHNNRIHRFKIEESNSTRYFV